MDRNITVLDKNTIDKIAAGEVVERPVSVVKELVENSIDAGAGAITVEIKDGGISYIRVTDNGCGIKKDQVKTAFLRHATSKIKSIEDLIDVGSLGFRGEALSSIAAVSKVELLTKTEEEFTGTRYVIEGSRELSCDDVGLPEGTTFIVRHIFYNTPARRKFLKTPQTEGSYISDFMEKIMLSNPDIAFKLIINNNTRLQSSGNGKITDIIYNLYGKDLVDGLLPIEADDGDTKITGYIGKPELSRGNRSFEIYYVNQRYIQSTVIRRALDEAYKPYLMLHKYPVVFLYFNISPELIDVNVHPTKKEIRFLEGGVLYDQIVKSIQETLSHKELIPDIHEKDKTISGTVKKIENENLRPEPFENKVISEYKPVTQEYKTPVIHEYAPVTPKYEKWEKADKTVESITDVNNTEEQKKPVQMSMFEDGFLSTEGIKKHRIIGQVFETYWIIEMDNRMYVIDQHAAHEKVKYERLIKQFEKGEVNSQMLNPPIIVTLSKTEEAVLQKYGENFKRIGFEIEQFGGNEYSIREIPTDLFGLTPVEYFHDLLDELMNDKLSRNIDSVDHRIATMACKSAVKGNSRLSLDEARTLIDELLTLDNPFNCPHGRPTIVSFSKSELEKMFKRIVS
ncbi:MAG TPA: DNA mismatch repair endonuclease MutL [Lachnospiraceae bacterium]|nr:DNA mismatch repair endonuclease MutL [Lachnospiraceae bacterium]